MKSNLCISISLIAVFALFGCGLKSDQKQEKEKIEGNIYYHEKFGWELKLLEDWELTSDFEEYLYKKSGDRSIKQEFKENAANTWTEILNLQVGNKINVLSAAYSKYDENIHGDSYERSKETRFNGIKRIMENKGLKVESNRKKVTIDQVIFDVFRMSASRNGEHKYHQILLETKYQNEEILLINITASEREKLKELKKAVWESKFKRKK